MNNTTARLLQSFNHVSLSIHMRNDLTAVSNKWHVEMSRATLLSWESSVTIKDITVHYSKHPFPSDNIWAALFVFVRTTCHTATPARGKTSPNTLSRGPPDLLHVNYSRSSFRHAARMIQRVSASVSVSQTLPFSLCVVQHCISLGYPLQDLNNTTSWWELGKIFVIHDTSPRTVCFVISRGILTCVIQY